MQYFWLVFIEYIITMLFIYTFASCLSQSVSLFLHSSHISVFFPLCTYPPDALWLFLSPFPITWHTCSHFPHLLCKWLDSPSHLLTCNSFHNQPLTIRTFLLPLFVARLFSQCHVLYMFTLSALYLYTIYLLPCNLYLGPVFVWLPAYWHAPFYFFVFCWIAFWFSPLPALFLLIPIK